MYSPKMTIGVIIYNREDYIRECLESIVSQEIDKEILLLDDCSTDGTYPILKEYAKKYPEIKIFRNNHTLGTVLNRFQAFKHATGEYLLMVDADDSLIPDTLPRLYEEACQFHADILEFLSLTDARDFQYQPHKKNGIITINQDLLAHFINKEIGNTLCNKLISKDVYLKILPQINEKLRQPNFCDCIFYMYHLLMNTHNVVQTDTKGYFYHSQRGMTHNLSYFERFQNRIGFLLTKQELERVYQDKIKPYIEQTHQKVYQQAMREYLVLSPVDRILLYDQINQMKPR